mgnify:CR=1 FL=1
MKKYGFLTLILCLFCLGEAAVASPGKADAAPAAQAQSSKLTVKGFVKDDKGDPMIGVTLIVKGTNFGTVSNADGSYSIDVPYGGATLMVSYIGYAPQEINVNNRTKIDITLLEDSKALEEVVVVGYNVQKKETITGSIATITTKDLKQSPTANINNALAGRMPGLLVNQFSGGEPGNDAAQLNIRGISTYGQSGVIMIVDGIERDMSYLAPDEIETFTILKDASATAPYGIRGANGVILITTREGIVGKPQINIRFEAGMVQPTKVPDILDAVQFAELWNAAAGSEVYTPEVIQKYRDGSDPDLYPNVDWVDYLYKDLSFNERVNVNVTGGGSTAKYYISGGFYNENGLFTSDNMKEYNTSVFYRKFNFRSNVEVQLHKYTKLNINLATTFERKNEPGTAASKIWDYAVCLLYTSPSPRDTR